MKYLKAVALTLGCASLALAGPIIDYNFKTDTALAVRNPNSGLMKRDDFLNSLAYSLGNSVACAAYLGACAWVCFIEPSKIGCLVCVGAIAVAITCQNTISEVKLLFSVASEGGKVKRIAQDSEDYIVPVATIDYSPTATLLDATPTPASPNTPGAAEATPALDTTSRSDREQYLAPAGFRPDCSAGTICYGKPVNGQQVVGLCTVHGYAGKVDNYARSQKNGGGCANVPGADGNPVTMDCDISAKPQLGCGIGDNGQ